MCSQHKCPPILSTIIHKLCVPLLHCHRSTDIAFCVALEVGQWVTFLAITAHSPENPSACTQQQTQLPPPTGIKHHLPTPTALKAAHWQEKHHGAAPSSPCHALSHSSLSSSAVHREQQMLHSKTVLRAREIYFGMSYVSCLQVNTVPEANAINRRREICAGALLQHKDVFRTAHTSLPACPRNLHSQMLLSRPLLR